jgi:hypothetical protein
MRLTRPATATWLIALVLGGLGILAHLGIFRIPGLGISPFWMVTLGYVLLLVAAVVKGL